MKTLKKIMLLLTVTLLAASTSLAQKPSNREEVKVQTNLDCEMCKKKIEDYMAFEKGVTAIKADVPSKVVTIEYRSNRTDEDKLVAALKKLGYEAEVIEESEPEKE
jgi:periplasmic mercuric ion binding protein